MHCCGCALPLCGNERGKCALIGRVSLEYNAISNARVQCDVAVCLVLVLLANAGGGGDQPNMWCLAILAPDIVIAEVADSCSSASQRREHVRR